MRHGIRRPHPPIRQRESQCRITLPKAANTGLAKKMELAARLQTALGLGPQDRPLPLMAAAAWLAVKDQGRDIRVPGHSGPVAMRKAELRPHINTAVTGRATGQAAVRVAQSAKTNT